MKLPTEIGNELESAVLLIEQAIIGSFPNLKEDDFDIETKKVISSQGVRHEIDILVRYFLPLGYNSTFIFECKNWKNPVNKNEIIVFSEKIDVTSAQRGFFVAKRFSRDAVAQAAQDQRIQLVHASEMDPVKLAIPFGFHVVIRGDAAVQVNVFGSKERPLLSAAKDSPEGHSYSRIEPNSVAITLNGESADFHQYLETWLGDEIDKDLSTFQSDKLPDGEYIREFSVERSFEDEFPRLSGWPVNMIELKVKYPVRVVRLKIRTAFDVQGRGRTVSFDRLSVEDSSLEISFAWTGQQFQALDWDEEASN